MKKRSFFVLVAGTVLFAYACSKSNDNPPKEEEKKPLVTAPEAVVAHDGKSGGVYKGVIIGSTGTVKIILQDGTVSAEVSIDGETRVLKPWNMPTGWTSGQALQDVIFKSENWTLTFSVTANGDHPYISAVSIPGHTDVAVHIIKEESDVLAKAFEGSFGKGDSVFGAMNFVLAAVEDTVFGIIQKQPAPKQSMYGHYDNSHLQFITRFSKDSLNFSAEGTLNGDEIEGKWKGFDYRYSKIIDSGYWKAKRTL